jgi:acyl-CoA thioesterase
VCADRVTQRRLYPGRLHSCLARSLKWSRVAGPLVVSATFLRPAAVGAAHLQTHVLRRGRRLATGEVSLFQGGQPIVRVCASFASLVGSRSRLSVANAPPALPPPVRCVAISPKVAMPDATVADQVEYRYAQLPGWATGRPGGQAHGEFWMRFRDGRPADAMSLPMLVDAAPPMVLDLGERDSITVELTVHVRALPKSGWLACRASTRHVMGGFHEEDFEIWDGQGLLVAQSRQLAILLESAVQPA